MKLAVFKISERGGKARLVCLEMASLQSAANLEHWFRMNVDSATEVTLLGRFDSVCLAVTEQEAESFILARGETHLSNPGIAHSAREPQLEAQEERL
jgi:hypothetical protein